LRIVGQCRQGGVVGIVFEAPAFVLIVALLVALAVVAA
jgi:hypothetical protein